VKIATLEAEIERLKDLGYTNVQDGKKQSNINSDLRVSGDKKETQLAEIENTESDIPEVPVNVKNEEKPSEPKTILKKYLVEKSQIK